VRAALARHVPAVAWLPGYDRSWLSKDALAGLSVWALLVPQGIAYASIAGVPAQYGLYAALGGLAGYALFGTSRQLVVGPSATVAAVSATVVGGLVATGSQDFVAYSAALALAVGVIYVALGLARMGWIANFLSKAVLAGFVTAFGIGLIINQAPKILGVDGEDGSYVEQFVNVLDELGDTNGTTLAIGIAAIALLLGMRRFVPTWPRALIVVVIGIAASAAFSLSDHGVTVVGKVPTGLPSVGIPDFAWSDAGSLLAGALAVIFVGFSETLAAAKQAASNHGYEVDVSQEMVAQGTATGASGLLGGFVVDGSLSKTTVADLAGQRTQIASVFCAGLILLTVLFLAGIFTDLPQAVLGAVVIDAAIGLIKVVELRRFAATSRTDFAAYVAAGIGLLFVGVLVGILIGVILSLLLLIAAASRSPVRRLALDRRNNVYVDAARNPDADQPDGIVVAEINGPLFFADAEHFRSEVYAMVTEYDAHAVVLDLDSAATIDLDGADVLTLIDRELGRKQVEVVLARVGGDHMELLRRAGTLDAVGEVNVYPTVGAAVAALGSGTEPTTADPPRSRAGTPSVRPTP
jgi:sulfate permease, SulP family